MKFQRSVLLPVRAKELFAFHADVRNIGRVSPPGIATTVLRNAHPPKAGRTFLLQVRQFGVPLQWRGRWAVVERPHLLVDTAEVFPFKSWRHEHRFEEGPGGTRLTDTVRCQLPWYFGGFLAEMTLLRLFFGWMFWVRHRKTRKIFS